MARGLEEMEIYQRSMKIAENIYDRVIEWDTFLKSTIGSQLIRSCDSIAANISEGFGRFYYKDSKRFYYFARGSLFETKTWIEKSTNRKLISKQSSCEILNELNVLGVKLNNFINSIGIN